MNIVRLHKYTKLTIDFQSNNNLLYDFQYKYLIYNILDSVRPEKEIFYDIVLVLIGEIEYRMRKQSRKVWSLPDYTLMTSEYFRILPALY